MGEMESANAILAGRMKLLIAQSPAQVIPNVFNETALANGLKPVLATALYVAIAIRSIALMFETKP